MKPKFVILHNGLKNLCGHYFETSISIAEAASRAGFHPVISTHVDCPAGLFPPELEVHRIHTTDHWMDQPPVSSPTTATTLRRSGGFRSHVQRVGWACRKAAWCVDRAWYYLPPPFVYDATLALARTFGHLRPRALRPGFRQKLRQWIYLRVVRARHGAYLDRHQVPAELACGESELARGLRDRRGGRFVVEAWRVAADAGLGRQFDYALVFHRDLERLLKLADVRRGDHVLLNTAHARELLAVYLAARRLGARSPTFHLVFRHRLFAGGPSGEEAESSPLIRPYAMFIRLYRRWGVLQNIHFHTDTEELAAQYASLEPLPYGILPIPFRSRLIGRRGRSAPRPICLAYLGEARDDKGFHWLPSLIDALWDDYVAPGKVRFLIQATIASAHHHPQSVRALEKLRQYRAPHVELHGLDGPLAPQAYYDLVSEADAMVLPFDRRFYGAGSSGTLAEALAAGCPAVVPSRTWMARQVPHGAGETFDDYDSFLQAVRKLIDGFEDYRRRADEHRTQWLARHSPDALVAAIAGTRRQTAAAERQRPAPPLFEGARRRADDRTAA